MWCVPGGPYADPVGVIDAIAFARKAGRPFLGTCAGFQHALVEYARNEWRIEALHAESDPHAGTDALISALECPLIQVAAEVHFVSGTRLRQLYGVERTSEEYQCRYGLNPIYAARLEQGPLRVCARDPAGDVRAVELEGHPFFFAALFQPERAALPGRTPLLVKALVAAAAGGSRSAGQSR